jgi:N,N'-diacetyllegionaminate synthase
MKPVFIIAEAGVNHNGDLGIAKQLIDVAADAGADAVKFQTFKAESLATNTAAKAAYQQETTEVSESQFAMLKRLELDIKAHEILKAHCDEVGVGFLSTPFDEQSADMLVEMGLPLIKIPSGEITNLPYLYHVGGLGKQIILSTGMSTLKEVGDAIAVLERGGTRTDDITILHCNTQYPTPYEDTNLLAMQALAEAFPKCNIGFSDHTQGIECSIAAAALGARVIEKHFTLDCGMEGPDHKASIEPNELASLVRSVRNIEVALGTGNKEPSPSERDNILIARKYLVALRSIAAGEELTTENLGCRRTGNGGVSPMRWGEVLGTLAIRDFTAGESIEI